MKYTNNGVEDIKIAYIGGGSRGWAWGFMSDLAAVKDMCGSVYLYDIDMDAARKNETIGNNVKNAEGCKSAWKYKAVDTIEKALTGADFVVISILPGTFDEMESDVHLSEKYGIYQSVGDTAGAGGIIRALRTIPMFEEIAENIKKYWPEVMVTYDKKDKVLFSADGFGKFGTLDTDEDWDCEARRYYFNIVGRYGAQVQTLLKKAAALDIEIICPLHGPVLKENLEHYIGKYDIWSKYEPENKGITIAYASIHGNTAEAAKKFAEILKAQGEEKVSLFDLSRDDMAEAVEDAFRYDGLVLASATYDGGLFPCMEDFLAHLKSKTYRNRTVAIIENGSWGPMAAKHIRAALEGLKNMTVLEKAVTIKSTMKESNIAEMEEMAKELRAALGR